MGLGDIVRTAQPTPVVVWRKKAAAYTTPAAGDPTAFDSSGDMIIAVDTTDGPLCMLTTLNKTVSSVVYYQILIFGIGILKCGASAIKPNLFVGVNSSSLVAPVTTTVSAGFTQAEIQRLWRVLGMYLGLEADVATNDYAVSDAASTNLIMVFVGRGL